MITHQEKLHPETITLFFRPSAREAENKALVIKDASLARDWLSIVSLPEIQPIREIQDGLHNLWGPLFKTY